MILNRALKASNQRFAVPILILLISWDLKVKNGFLTASSCWFVWLVVKNFYNIVIWGQALKDETERWAKGFCLRGIFPGKTLDFPIGACKRE